MQVIHGIWAYGALWLWAEDSGLEARAAPRPGHPARAPRPHPFSCEAAVLADTLAGLGDPLADLARKAVDGELTLWLPSTADGPAASPELSRPAGTGPPSRRRPALAAWQVPALIFGPAGALDALTSLPGEGSVLGGSLRFLAALARLALDLASRGRVLPVLAEQEDGYAARWRVVLTGADAQRAGQLAAAMPPVCRATAAAGDPPAQVLTDVLDALADAAVRGRLAGLDLVPRRGRGPARLPVAQRWLAALTAADAIIELLTDQDEAEAAKLAGELAAWHSAAQAPAGPVRTCFRLIEPEPHDDPELDYEPEPGYGPDPDAELDQDYELDPDHGPEPDAGPEPDDNADPDDRPEPDDGRWLVEFSLQSTDDPSLVMPAADIWAGTAGWAVGGIRHPEEELLAGLGTASRLFPELDAELRTAAPAIASLDTAGAFRFLKQTAPLLSGAGFGVLLPDWARKARLGLKLTARSRSTAGASAGVTEPKFGLQDLVDFRYELAVGDQTLDPDDLAELARLKIPLVRIRGQWVELDDAHLQAALRFLERRRSGTMSAGDALLAGLRGEEDLPVVQADADGWLGSLLSGQAERRIAPVPTPAAFTGSLRPYQERGLAWMAFLSSIGLGGVLADSMGLGKTIQLLALLAHERESAADAVSLQPTLLICPMSLVGNWEQEAAKFTPQLRVHVHHGAGRLTGDELAAALTAADLVITTYAIATRDQEALAGIRWARVVCDEAQNIKNSAARQARAVRGIPAGCRIALTGTPVENRLAELWSIMEFTNPGLLGSAERFRSGYAVPIERHGDAEATQRLRRLTGPFILRRLKTDSSIISDLPDKQEMKVWCNLTAEQASLYQATVTDMLAKIEAAPDGIQRRGLVLATMAKLKQACNHPAHLLGDGSRLPGRSGKLARLEEICDEIVAEGDKALCFTQYAEFGSMLQPYLAARLGCPVLYLHGGTPKKKRDALVAQFNSETEPAVFLLSLKAGGTGLNLTAANHVIHIDRWWNPAVEDQATDRAYRIGQTRDVQVRKFVCVGTLEERIDQMIEEKKALADSVVGTGESWLADLSVAELRQVINLSPEAVSE
jgi:SNF2 family DNA or RNA helicase